MDTMTTGQVLGSGFRTYVRNLPAFLLMALLCYAPIIIWAIAVLAGSDGQEPLERLRGMETFNSWAGLLMILLDVPLSAMLTYGVVQELAGQRASIGACVATGVKRFLPALLLMALIFLVVIVIVIAMIIPAAVSESEGFVVVMMFAMMAVLLSLYARWFVAVPVSVIEQPGVFASMSRSSELTSERRWRVVAVIVVTYALHIAVMIAAYMIIIPHAGDADHLDENLRRIPLYIVIQLGITAAFGSLRAVMAATAYSFLRRDKDGVGTDELANVFG
jgi:hypothetical protein